MSDEFNYKPHPYAAIFPLMSEVEFAALVEDIRAHGLKHPITKTPAPDNLIIDGRNRLNACRVAGKPPRFEDFKGGSVLDFIETENLHRRQLNVSQRSMVAARIKRARRGEDWRGLGLENKARPQKRAEAEPRVHADQETVALAKTLNVSKASVERADIVVAKGVPELADAVDRGEVAISKAAGIAHLPAAEQRERLTQTAHPEPRPRAQPDRNAGGVMMEMRNLAKNLKGSEIASLIEKWIDNTEVSLALASNPAFLHRLGGGQAAWSSMIAWLHGHRRDSERGQLAKEAIKAIIHAGVRQEVIEEIAGVPGLKARDAVIVNEPCQYVSEEDSLDRIAFHYSKISAAARRSLKASWSWQRDEDEPTVEENPFVQ
jgi:ParB-like chromosome segregation protein Spo0J